MVQNPQRETNQRVKERVKAILRGAFAGPPTPLKDIPKRNGESRESRPVKRRAMKKVRPK